MSPFALASWVVISTAISPAQQPADANALQRYVQKPDATYAWKVAKTVDGSHSKTLIVHLKSQTWRNADEVDRPVWEHWLVIIKPEKPASNKAFLLIGGGANDRPMPTKADQTAQQIAEATNTVVAELRMIPNQPLVFHKDGKPRKEDDLIGYCWDQFLKTNDETWLPRLPMVKSAVRAMDCIQELMKSDEGDNVQIDKFVVAGGSKRGWTTWLTGAVDPRVEAIVPIVIDLVNVTPSMRHHGAVYGFWAKAIGNYFEHRIMQRANDPRLEQLYRIVDPYYHRDRLTMPKYIVNASGDQFFCPDSSQFYFDDLKGEKLLRYVPNADHSLRGSDAVLSIAAYYQTIVNGTPRPKLSWTFEKDGSIRARSDMSPKNVALWQATNPKARDFRVDTIGRTFASRELKEEPDGSYVGNVDKPKEGWTAYFIELTYDVGAKYPLKLTTAVRVVPDKLPFADMDPTMIPYEGRAGGK